MQKNELICFWFTLESLITIINVDTIEKKLISYYGIILPKVKQNK